MRKGSNREKFIWTQNVSTKLSPHEIDLFTLFLYHHGDLQQKNNLFRVIKKVFELSSFSSSKRQFSSSIIIFILRQKNH